MLCRAVYASRAERVSRRRRTKLWAEALSAGYSQSMSRPSRPRFWRSSMAEEANLARPEGVDAGRAKLEE